MLERMIFWYIVNLRIRKSFEHMIETWVEESLALYNMLETERMRSQYKLIYGKSQKKYVFFIINGPFHVVFRY